MSNKITPTERLLMLIALQNYEKTRLDVMLCLPESAEKFEACRKVVEDAKNGLLKCLGDCKNFWDEQSKAERALYAEMEDSVAKEPVGFKPPKK